MPDDVLPTPRRPRVRANGKFNSLEYYRAVRTEGEYEAPNEYERDPQDPQVKKAIEEGVLVPRDAFRNTAMPQVVEAKGRLFAISANADQIVELGRPAAERVAQFRSLDRES